MIPVSIVTGFLGSGKTTLISRVLRDKSFARTAVIVNEFGEIGLDHELLATGDETFMALTSGCLCCSVRSNLIETILELRDRASDRFDRILIETSGLADPGPILQALMTDGAVYATHVIDTVVTVVDPVHGEATMEQFPEARRQVALADRLLFSKADLASPNGSLLDRIDGLNRTAPRGNAIDATPGSLFGGADAVARAARLAVPPDRTGASPFARARHADGIETEALRRPRPMPALALTLWLQALMEHCGDRLIRVKGIVALEEMAWRPAIIHGVQHIFSPPEFLDRWPSEDKETRLVFIYRDMPRHLPARLLDAIEEEVREELASRA